MKIYTGPEAQPGFPEDDLSDKNADALELLLANKLVVQQSHTAAEQAEWAFCVGHPAAVEGGSSAVDIEGARVAALEHGVMVFEAIAVAVAGLKVTQDKLAINHAVMSVRGARVGDTIQQVLEMEDQFRDEMPRTVGVIESTSRRHFGPATNYAVLGAALERHIALSQVIMDYERE